MSFGWESFGPDPGHQATFEVNDLDENIYNAFERGQSVFVGEIKVKILSYDFLKPLGFNPGYRAKITCERVA